MSDTEQKTPVGYETTDADPRTLVFWGLSIVGVLLLSALTAWAFFTVLARQADRSDPRLSALALAESRVPPGPRLLDNEMKDVKAFREEQRAILNTYGWVDKDRGVVRVPIERALELVAREGLPTRAKTGGAP